MDILLIHSLHVPADPNVANWYEIKGLVLEKAIRLRERSAPPISELEKSKSTVSGSVVIIKYSYQSKQQTNFYFLKHQSKNSWQILLKMAQEEIDILLSQ